MTAALPAAILAGGLATRLGELTRSLPKCLVPIAGEPFIDRQLHLLASRGVREVVLCVGYLSGAVEAHVGDGARWGLRVRYSADGPAPLGTGGAVRNAVPLLGERFLVVYGDSYVDLDYAEMSRCFEASGKAAMMAVYRNEGRWDRSNVLLAGEAFRYDKKNPSPDMRHIDAGVLAFRSAAFGAAEPGRAFDLADLCMILSERGELAAYEAPRRFFEIGSRQGIADLEEFLAGNAAQ